MKEPETKESDLPEKYRRELEKIKKEILNLAKKPQKKMMIGDLEDDSDAFT